METKASYVVVGSFVLLLVLGALGFVIWLINAGDSTPRIRYDMIATESVTGLRVGGDVRLNGVKVGQVSSIALDPNDPSRVLIALQIAENVPIKTDTHASLQMEGLTGGRYVLLEGGTASAPKLVAEPGQDYPVIPMKPSAIDELLQGAPEVIDNINELLTRGNRLLSDENLANLSKSMADLADFTAMLAANRDRVTEVLDGFDQGLQSFSKVGDSVEYLAQDLAKDATRLTDKADDTLTKIGTLADTLNEAFGGKTRNTIEALMNRLMAGADAFTVMSDQIAAMVKENREPLRDFSAQGLFELVNFLAEARELVSSLRQLTTNVDRDPARFFFGNQQEGYEPSDTPRR